MSEEAPRKGHVVDFSCKMTPSSHLRIMPPAERATEEAERLTPLDFHRGTKGGIMIMKILTMTPDEKRAHVITQVDDPLFMWWSFLSLEERREFLRAAETNLKERLMG